MTSATLAFALGSVTESVFEHMAPESISTLRTVNRDFNESARRLLFNHAVAKVHVDENGASTAAIAPLGAGPTVHINTRPRPVTPLNDDDKRLLGAVKVLDIHDADTLLLKAIAMHRRTFSSLQTVRVFPSHQRYTAPSRPSVHRRPLKAQAAQQPLPYRRSPIIGYKVIYFPAPNFSVPCLLRTVEAAEVIINIDLNAMNPDSAEHRMTNYMPRCPLAIGLKPRLAVVFTPRHPKSKVLTVEFAYQLLARLAWHLRTHAHPDTVPGHDYPIKREAMPRFMIAGLEKVAEATDQAVPFHELRNYLINEFSFRFSCVGCPRPETCKGQCVIPRSQQVEHILDLETYSDYMNSISESSRRLEQVDSTHLAQHA